MIQPLREISATTGRLSTYISGALAHPLPQAVIEKGRQHILDTVAAMISGTHLRPGRLAIAYAARLGGARQASIVGTRLLTSPVTAALANGMLAHADETDDSHAPSRTHPGCAVIPSALAVAESVHATGEHLLKAVVLGYDVAARMNYALGAGRICRHLAQHPQLRRHLRRRRRGRRAARTRRAADAASAVVLRAAGVRRRLQRARFRAYREGV